MFCQVHSFVSCGTFTLWTLIKSNKQIQKQIRSKSENERTVFVNDFKDNVLNLGRTGLIESAETFFHKYILYIQQLFYFIAI